MGVKSPEKKKSVAARVPDVRVNEIRQSVRDNLDASEKRLQRSRKIVSESKDIVERSRQAIETAKNMQTELAEDRQQRVHTKSRRDGGSGRA